MIATKFLQRLVIDTNVFVSAALFNRSVSGLAVEMAFVRSQVLIGDQLILELGTVLGRRKFEKLITSADRRAFLTRVSMLSTLVPVTSDLHVCRDPKDNHILNLAIDGAADVVVSGDKDLLVLHPFCGISILSPAAFLAL